MDKVVPSTQKNLEGLGSVSTASSLYSSVCSTAVIISYRHDWVLVSNKMAPVQLLFVYQDDCIFQPYELFLDIETTCRAEMKPVAWRFVLFPDQFVRVSLQPVDEVCAWRLPCGLFICLPRRLKAVIANPLYNKITD